MIENLRDLIKRLEQFTSDADNPTGDDSPVVVVVEREEEAKENLDDLAISSIERDDDGVITIYCS